MRVRAVFRSRLSALAPTLAHANGAVLGADVTEARVAISYQGDRTTRWYSVGTNSSGTIVWVIPVAKEAAIDVASNGWLEALDTITAPRIAPSCGSAKMEVARTILLGANPSAPKASIVHDESELASVPVDQERRAQLASMLSTHDLVVLRASGPSPATIRVVDREGAVEIPFSLLRSSKPIDVTAFIIGDKRGSMGSIVPAPAPLHWFGNQSDWVLRRDAILSSASTGSFITESALPSSIVDETHVSPTIVPSLAMEYYSRAAVYGDATGSPTSCAIAASSMAMSIAPQYCARADLLGTTLVPCSYSSAFSCGSHADDLALALAGNIPRTTWVTRMFGRIAPNTTPVDATAELYKGDEVPLLRIALSTCGQVTSPGSNGGGNNGGGGSSSSSWGGSGGCSGSADTSSSSGGGDSCSSDTDDVSDDSGACGASADGADDGCSGSGSSGGGDDCDSGGSNAGDSCDSGGGDSCSGGGGDSCSGGGGDCDANNPGGKKKHAGKSPLSRVFLGLAFLALPLRRLTRKRS